MNKDQFEAAKEYIKYFNAFLKVDEDKDSLPYLEMQNAAMKLCGSLETDYHHTYKDLYKIAQEIKSKYGN